MQPAFTDPLLLDQAPPAEDMLSQCLAGLRSQPPELPCKFLYDERGSALYERICELPEYYPARCELQIMRDHACQMAELIGPEALLIELGSGSSRKTRYLLDALDKPAAYMPVEIARSALQQATQSLAVAYPHLNIMPICADYTLPLPLPHPPISPRKRCLYFPGSTIGNFPPDQARAFLDRLADLAGPGGILLIGVDLRKNPAVLIPAYADSQGVTAAFNRNILHRLNRELDADLAPHWFRHEVRWNDEFSRIEMHLVAAAGQSFHLGDELFRFARGEFIRTECSYKYTLHGFASLAPRFRLQQVWTDQARLFSVQCFQRPKEQ